MMSFVVWLILSFSTLLLLAGLFLWRGRKLARSRAVALMLEAVALGGLFVLLASRVSVLLFKQPLIPIDLPKLTQQTWPPAVGIVVGIAAACGLAWLATRIGARPAFTVLLALPLLVGVVATVVVRAEAARQAEPPKETVEQNPHVAPGFRITRFYAEANSPTTLTVGADGRVYWCEYLSGKIFSAADTNGDGVADNVKTFAEGYKGAKGLAFRPGTDELYVSSPGVITVLRDTNGDGASDERRVLLKGLSNFDNEHSTNGIAFGPDGKLYIAAGGPREFQFTVANGQYLYEGKPLDPLVGGILVTDPDGRNLRRFAKGMRNPYDLAFDAQGRLFATDNGADSTPNPLGDELNYVIEDGDYGYPEVYGFPPPWSRSQAPMISYRAHSSPDGLAVYESAQFPAEYRGNIFVALWSDTTRLFSQADIERGNTKAWRGSKIDRVRVVEKNGYLTGEESDFAWDFDHPIDVAVGADGAVYVADFTWKRDYGGGALYQITYIGK